MTDLELRRAMWLTHGCPVAVLYGDDGEMQCNALSHGSIDFKRDDLDEVVPRILAWIGAAWPTVTASSPLTVPQS